MCLEIVLGLFKNGVGPTGAVQRVMVDSVLLSSICCEGLISWWRLKGNFCPAVDPVAGLDYKHFWLALPKIFLIASHKKSSPPSQGKLLPNRK